MKKIFALFLVVGIAYGQILNETNDGLNHKLTQAYSKASYTSSTATETTSFIRTYDANRIAVWATATDSVKAVVQFQFKNSFTGYTTDFRATGDSISLIGSSSTLASDRIHAFVPSDTATLSFDLVRFRIDYVTYLGVAYTGGTVKIYTDIYKP